MCAWISREREREREEQGAEDDDVCLGPRLFWSPKGKNKGRRLKVALQKKYSIRTNGRELERSDCRLRVPPAEMVLVKCPQVKEHFLYCRDE